MRKALKQIKENLIELDELHADHIDTFDAQLLPDLDKQMAERALGFEKLKKNFMIFLDNTKDSKIVDNSNIDVKSIKDHIRLLMNKNKTLHKKIQTHKAELKSSIKQVTRGRQVIHAYGTPQSQRSQPRVLNFKN